MADPSPAKPPVERSGQASANRRQSLGFALAGLRYVLQTQKNTRIMLAATLAVMGLGFWLGADAQSWTVLSLAIAQVWIAEFINSAIEAAVDLSTQTYHPLAKRAKDAAAGAVLLASLAAAIVGALVLAPKLQEKLNGILALPTS